MTQERSSPGEASLGGTALVTGGAGFIGTALTRRLLENFERVVVVDSLHPQVHSSQSRPKSMDTRVELIRGDVSSRAVWDSALEYIHPDSVVHLAAETGTGQSLDEASRHAVTNVVGTTQMLDAFRRSNHLPARLVLASSRAVYGEGAWKQLTTGAVFYPGQRTAPELVPGEWDFAAAEPLPMATATVVPAPVSVYGACKMAQENIVTAWARAVGVETCILRFQNVYGPGQSLINSYTGVLSLFCRLAREGRSIPLYEDGAMRRDFVFIEDAAEALDLAVRASSGANTPIDIGSGQHHTIADAAGLIADYYNAPSPRITGQFREGDVRHAWADISEAESILGWRPQTALDRGLTLLAEWIERQTD